MGETQADTIVILSSDLIARIAQDYFNKIMFKQKVEIVDLKPHGESGYAFSIAFTPPKQKPVFVNESVQVSNGVHNQRDVRDNKGRFVKSL